MRQQEEEYSDEFQEIQQGHATALAQETLKLQKAKQDTGSMKQNVEFMQSMVDMKDKQLATV